MKLLLKNARIYDGTGAAARNGDVLVDNDRIAQVGAELPMDGADQVLDLQELRHDTFTGDAMFFVMDPDGLPIEIHE